MGNCLRHRQPVTMVDGDDEEEHWIKTEKAEELTTSRPKETSAPSTEVRIRISKKQLEEFLRQAEIKGLPTRDVMIELINMSMAESNEIIHDQYHWKPALRSIAEEPDD
ncbi:uncharacterized protein LOC110096326 [Dendrobium catenatum]|uniref:Uncharacterized protein n=1 Tax=Dendrobium catenatum TaxID=906689 RepID=A0A2I0XFM0_9ASPA|nr:uncharacterized protein LOC110096326 [Dendrobium catenatum]PKU86716.1 hypothetical protein MA16_Dca023880 [Dendrobium catenatum]